MITPQQRLARMHKSFENDKSVLVDDYMYFTAPNVATTPRGSIHPNTAAHRSAEQNERQSLERSETRSSDKTGD